MRSDEIVKQVKIMLYKAKEGRTNRILIALGPAAELFRKTPLSIQYLPKPLFYTFSILSIKK
ncbi:MAG: hypothetical protein V1874_11935 [Spirochaetota bacterium]